MTSDTLSAKQCPHLAVTFETVTVPPSTSAMSLPIPPFLRTRCLDCGAIHLATGEWRMPNAPAAEREGEERPGPRCHHGHFLGAGNCRECSAERAHPYPPPAGASCLLCGHVTVEWAIWTPNGVGLCFPCRDLPHRLAAREFALIAARQERDALRAAANAVIEEHRKFSNLVIGGETPSLLDLEDAIAALATPATSHITTER